MADKPLASMPVRSLLYVPDNLANIASPSNRVGVAKGGFQE
ncbi:MAG: hypothetical protein OFPI_37410 [Osedax symbiont Rs2]|nr:MAG: hypothetical protein OFPI_37410 [Osedax symbiont Rs2]